MKLIKIRKEYEENLPKVSCEGSKIQQVLLNILRNGAEAMDEYTKECISSSKEILAFSMAIMVR